MDKGNGLCSINLDKSVLSSRKEIAKYHFLIFMFNLYNSLFNCDIFLYDGKSLNFYY